MSKNWIYACAGLGLVLVIATSLSPWSSARDDRESDSIEKAADAPVSSNKESKSYPLLSGKSGNGNWTVSDSLISLSTGFDHTAFIEGETDRSIYYYTEIKAGEFEPEGTERVPLNISLVLDHSGSMAGEKLNYAKEAARFVVDQLTPEDNLSIVIYDDQVELLLPAQKVENKTTIKNLINQVYQGGSTNLSGGMLKGYSEVKKMYDSNKVNRVLLLSDGLANEGIVEPELLNEICRKKFREEGISISTFGVGADYNEDLMEALAENGSGSYYFIASPDEIPQVFRRELEGLLNVVAQNMTLDITLPKGTSLSKLMGYKYDYKDNLVTVNFGDVFSQETKAVLLKLDIDDKDVAQKMLVNTRIQWDDVVADLETKELAQSNEFFQVADSAQYEASLDSTVMTQVVVFESNEKLQLAIQYVDAGDYEMARSMATSNQLYLESNMLKGFSTQEVLKQSQLNSDYNESIQQVEEMNAYDKTMMQKSNKMYNRTIRKKK